MSRMTRRELAYSIFHGENSRPGIHIECDDKRIEYQLSDFLSSRVRISTWDKFFISGGPFHRWKGEKLRKWIERINSESYEWESIYDDLIKGVEDFRKRISRFKGRFIILKVLGPTETAESFFARPLSSRHINKGQLAHTFDFGLLLSLDFKRAIEIYEKIAEKIMILIELGCEIDFVDAIRIADDVAAYTGPIYSKKFIYEYLKWHEKFTKIIHKAGKLAILHTDGDVRKLRLLERFSEIYNGIHPLDIMPKSTVRDALTWVNEICSIRCKLKGRLVFFTGIPIDLVFNDRVNANELLQVVRKLINCHGVKYLVVATTHSPYPWRSYSEKIPLGKVLAIREFVMTYYRKHKEPIL